MCNNPKTTEYNTLFDAISIITEKKYSKVIIATFFVAISTVFFFIDYYKNINSLIVENNGFYPIILYAINLLLSGSIILFVFISRSQSRRIQWIEKAMDDSKPIKENKEDAANYSNFCTRFYGWIHLGIKNPMINGEKKSYRILHCSVKLLFFLIWLLGMLFFYFFTYNYTNLFEGISGIFSGILFGISAILESYSFFTCFTYIRFLHLVSNNNNRKKLKQYKYNKYLPSHTAGFKQLMSNINFNSVCYVFESIIFLTTYVCIVLLKKEYIYFDITSDIVVLVFFSLYTSLCVIGSIVTYLTPKYMMRRILIKWIDNSRKLLEKRLFILEDKLKTNNKKQFLIMQEEEIITSQIKNLDQDSFLFRGEIIYLVLVGLTLIATIAPIILQIIKVI